MIMRNLVLIIGSIIAIVATMLFSDIITIGDKIGEITHVYVEYAFYLILIILSIVYLGKPLINVWKAPKFPKLCVDDYTSVSDLRIFARKLAENCSYIHNKKQRASHRRKLLQSIQHHSAEAEHLRTIISNEIALRMDGDKALNIIGVNNRIKEWGKTVFMITALSQNSKFDTLTVLVLNYRSVADIVRASGFRPTTPQLFKLYIKVLTTALITYCTSQVFNDMNGVAPFDFLDDVSTDDIDVDIDDINDVDDVAFDIGAEGGLVSDLIKSLRNIRIPGVVVGSLADGCVNALMTMRIGYVTKAYLTEGADALSGSKNKRRIKRMAIKESFVSLPSVLKSGSIVAGKNIAKIVEGLLQGQKK